jgi:hypothetical protein
MRTVELFEMSAGSCILVGLSFSIDLLLHWRLFHEAIDPGRNAFSASLRFAFTTPKGRGKMLVMARVLKHGSAKSLFLRLGNHAGSSNGR